MNRAPFIATAALLAAMAASPVSALGQAGEGSLAALDPVTRDSIARIIERAKTSGVPVEPLLGKVRYGTVRHVSGDRIHAAVRDLAARLETSQSALAPAPTDAEVAAGADALGAGVAPATLSQLRRASTDRSLVVPLGVLTELVTKGMPVANASSHVLDLLGRGAQAAHFIALSRNVQADLAAGIPIDAALDLRLKGILPTLPGVGSSTVNTAIKPPD